MKNVLRAVTLTFVLIGSQANALTVIDDLGGEVEVYKARAADLGRSRELVQIGGKCSSSCNIYLMKQFNVRACALPGATLRFHMPFHGNWADASQTKVIVNTDKGQISISRKLWYQDWLGKFPKRLDDILKRATMGGKIPNPSETGDLSQLYEVKAELVLPACPR